MYLNRYCNKMGWATALVEHFGVAISPVQRATDSVNQIRRHFSWKGTPDTGSNPVKKKDTELNLDRSVQQRLCTTHHWRGSTRCLSPSVPRARVALAPIEMTILLASPTHSCQFYRRLVIVILWSFILYYRLRLSVRTYFFRCDYLSVNWN
jgi:hypothetical protein